MIIKHCYGGLCFVILSLLLAFNTKANTYINPAVTKAHLGMGIDSATGKLKGNCINGEINHYQNESINLSLESAVTAEQSLEDFQGTFKGDVNLGLFGAGATVDVHIRIAENENSASLVYHIKYRAGSKVIENRDYTALGTSMHGKPISEISDTCGDEFIDSVELGNDLYFTTQMHFSSKEELRKFVTKIRVRVLFWTSTTTITSETYNYAASGIYAVKAISNAPLPSAITDVLGSSGEKYCRVIEIEMGQCVSAANTVLDYLLGTNSEYRDHLTNPSNLQIIKFTSMPYDKAAHFELQTEPGIIDPALRTLENTLMTELNENQVKHNVATAYADRYGLKGDILVDQLNDNIDILQGALATCADTLSVATCQSATDSALADIEDVNIDIEW